MRAEEIIAKAELVHSCPIKWSLKSYCCTVFVVKEEPIDDLSLVVCSLVDKCCNGNNKISIGIMLGFSIIDDEPNSYFDAAELALFEDLLKIVEDHHLITVKDNTIALTNLGSISLQEEKIYTFYKTSKALYEHLILNAPNAEEMKMFPFCEDMGISSQLNSISTVWPDDNDVERIIFDDLSPLSERLNLISEEPAHIYDPIQSPYFDVKTISVNVNLYEDRNGYYPIIVNGDKVATKATELLYLPCNNLLLEKITLECRFKKLWADRSAKLDYSTLEPFFEFVDFDELVIDERIVWEDDRLFHKVAEEGTTDCWISISKKAPMAVLYSHMDEYSDRYDWGQLSDSSRADDDYLIEHFLDLPWDLEIISNDQYRDVEVIEKLILLKKDTIDVWDWDALKSRLSREFILGHLDIVDVNLSDYTEDEESIRTLIKAYPDKFWDWNKIESLFNLEFILENIADFEKHLAFNELMDRAFSDEDWCDAFATNSEFIDAAKNNIENQRRLASSIYNDKDYIWNDDVIEVFTTLGLISWETTRYMQGFECNDFLIWNPSFFAKYHDKVTSQAGFTHISKSIIEVNLLSEYPSFPWDWDAISCNERLLSRPELFSKYSDHLNWINAITTLPSTSLVESISGIENILGENEETWTAFSKKAHTDFVKTHPLFSWNWSILTKRMFSKLKPQNIGHHSFVDKWDWNFLSSELDPGFISENLARFKDKWNWSTILGRITNPSERTSESQIKMIAGILNSIDDKSAFTHAWKAFTEQYNLSELKTISSDICNTIEIHWDFDSICCMDGFNVFDDLDAFGESVDWNAVSKSEVIGKQLTFNPRMGIKEAAWKDDVKKLLSTPGSQWDFSALSHFESLNSQEWFLTNYLKKVDWDFVSTVSKVFCATDKQETNRIVEKFKDNIHFDKLSLRTDINIDQIVKSFPDEDYDYNAMIANNAFKASADFVDEHRDYNWDWKLLSSLEAFVPDEHFMFKYANKPFDWGVLSNRDFRSVWSSERTIKRLAHNSDACEKIDWFKVSSYSGFPLSDGLFEVLPLDKLNWKSISRRRKSYLLIDNYGSYLDWKSISENPGFKVIDDDNIEKYKYYLNWTSLCTRDDFKIDNDRIEKYADFIDWSAASASHDIIFTVELVEKYKDKWDWPVLVRNCAFNNNVQMLEHGYLKQENIITFLDSFQRKPRAYHFSHMSNAVKIIQTMKLRCRHMSKGNFENSAGANVNISDKAHKFARFYYISKSPTLFYNECLGKDQGDKYYLSAVRNGLPKCPLPVFFVVDIEELLMKMPDKCFYSDGNMQKSSTRYFKVVDDPTHIDGYGVYDEYNKDAKQQEFLVDKELDLSSLSSLRIYCYDDYQRNMLKSLVADSPLANLIETNYSLYERCNKELYFSEDSETLHITTDYVGQYEFRVEYNKGAVPTIEDFYSAPKEKQNNIYLNGAFEIRKDTPFKIYFEVTTPRTGSWLIYQNE